MSRNLRKPPALPYDWIFATLIAAAVMGVMTGISACFALWPGVSMIVLAVVVFVILVMMIKEEISWRKK
jgi:hypothetical protein